MWPGSGVSEKRRPVSVSFRFGLLIVCASFTGHRAACRPAPHSRTRGDRHQLEWPTRIGRITDVSRRSRPSAQDCPLHRGRAGTRRCGSPWPKS
jgi:hypothetical protein